MAEYDGETMEIVRRLQATRMAVLSKQPFFGVLLMNFRMALDKSTSTSYTDGIRLSFNPDFLKSLSDSELELVMMHEALHAALGHPFRVQADYELELYDLACDIVVNSNIFYSFGEDEKKITIKQFGVLPHKTPSGKEGYERTVEEVYNELLKSSATAKKKKRGKADGAGGGGKSDSDAKTDTDDSSDDSSQDERGEDKTGETEERDKSSSKASRGGKGKNKENSNVNEELSIEALISSIKKRNKFLKAKYDSPSYKERCTIKVEVTSSNAVFDDHTFWQGDDPDNSNSALWYDRTMRATEIILEKEKSHVGFGGPPLCAQRLLKELRETAVDWRTLLNDFIQEEVNDYSFSPPDRRMDDSPFFLPDFNEKDDSVKNIWFLIDTSGSIGDEAISAAYSEIISAMEMFNSFEGLLSFTEVFVTEPIPFCSPEELLKIKPVGGGGNDFGEIFRFMQRNMMDKLPASIVILTDGYDTYPEESEALGIPVLWLINNKEAIDPPWGKFARFEIGKKGELK